MIIKKCNFMEEIKNNIFEFFENQKTCIQNLEPLKNSLVEIKKILIKKRDNGNKIIVFGNGGSASCELASIGTSVWDKGFTSLWSYWEPFNPSQWLQYNKANNMDAGAGYWLFVPGTPGQIENSYSPSTTCGGFV